jgi:hypothetical protein
VQQLQLNQHAEEVGPAMVVVLLPCAVLPVEKTFAHGMRPAWAPSFSSPTKNNMAILHAPRNSSFLSLNVVLP